ncbi:hypothetical protein H4R35_000597, partial [Dimargaris xerosporica]
MTIDAGTQDAAGVTASSVLPGQPRPTKPRRRSKKRPKQPVTTPSDDGMEVLNYSDIVGVAPPAPPGQDQSTHGPKRRHKAKNLVPASGPQKPSSSSLPQAPHPPTRPKAIDHPDYQGQYRTAQWDYSKPKRRLRRAPRTQATSTALKQDSMQSASSSQCPPAPRAPPTTTKDQIDPEPADTLTTKTANPAKKKKAKTKVLAKFLSSPASGLSAAANDKQSDIPGTQCASSEPSTVNAAVSTSGAASKPAFKKQKPKKSKDKAPASTQSKAKDRKPSNTNLSPEANVTADSADPMAHDPSSKAVTPNSQTNAQLAMAPKPKKATAASNALQQRTSKPEVWHSATDSRHRLPKPRSYFAPYLLEDALRKGLASGKYFEGEIRINRKDPDDAYVTCCALDQDVFIFGKDRRNRAFDGDRVVVQLVNATGILKAKDKARDRVRQRINDRKANKPQPVAIVVNEATLDEACVKDEASGPEKLCGKVVHVYNSDASRTTAGMLRFETESGFLFTRPPRHRGDAKRDVPPSTNSSTVIAVYVKSSDPRMPMVQIPLAKVPHALLKNPSATKDKLYQVRVSQWPPTSRYPMGHQIVELGKSSSLAGQKAALLADNNVEAGAFSAR